MAAPSSSSEADKEAASNDDGRRGRGPSRVRPDHPRCVASCLSSIEACTDSVAECTDGMDRRQLQRNEEARRKRDERGSIPDPIWKRKGIVPLVFIVLAWVYLVYVWRLCSPAIRQQDSPSSHPVRLASRPTGIGLLVAFNILWLMTLWCYLRVILTPPGYVNDYFDKESMPSPIQSEWMRDNVGGPYLGEEQTQPIPHSQQQQEQAPQASGSGEATESPAGPHDNDGHPVDPSMPALVGPIGAGMLAASAEDDEHRQQRQRQHYQSTPATFDESSSQTQTIQPPPPAALKPSSTAAPALPVPSHQQQRSNAPPPVWQGLTPKPVRSPPYPDYAPLARSNRYCHRCRHVKTPRAHHCRHCGRCVMRMDHHCPWVGGCVGARNHKFFWHFLLWVTILELFTLISAAILFTRGVNGGDRGQYSAWTVDGFVISLFPICGLFILFTSPLLVTHSWLLSINQTTIEHLEVARINRREELSLQSYFSKGGVGFEEETKGKGPWSFEALRGKKRIQKEWEGEWGHLRYEANLWKVEQEAPLGAKGGERYKKQTTRFKDGLLNWRFMMGQQPWQWVLPLGHSASDGRDYPVNPRHGEYGQWRTRREWPEELR